MKNFRALLGIDEKGKIVPLITESYINPLGTRFERGDNGKFPTSVYLAWQGEVSDEEYVQCLRDLERFCQVTLNKDKKQEKKK